MEAYAISVIRNAGWLIRVVLSEARPWTRRSSWARTRVRRR